MAAHRKLYHVSSLLMAALFAISATFQFNDIDWYFWIPLYAGGSAVNLMSCFWSLSGKTIQRMAKFSLWLGIFLFFKVIVESIEVVGIWSLDMRQRVVREKLGSCLVFVSVILQLAANKKDRIQESIGYGMVALVGIGYGLSVVFHFYPKDELKF